MDNRPPDGPVPDASGAAEGVAAPARPRRLWLFVRIAVAAVLVVVLLRTIDYRAVLATLAGVDLGLVALVFAIAFGDRFIMAFKWNLLLRAQGRGFSHFEAFRIYLASAFVGAWLPTGVGGDLFRAVRGSVSGRGVSNVSVTILLERALGLLAVTVLSAAALGLVVLQGDLRMRDVLIAALILMVATLGGLALSIHPGVFAWIRAATARHATRRPVRMFLSLHDAYLELSRERGLLVVFFLLSVFEQFVQVVMIYTAACALHLPVSLLHFAGLMPISNVLIMLPISIASIGVQEATFVVLLALTGMSAKDALSLSLLLRAIGWMMLLPSGAAFLWDSARLKREGRVTAS